MFKLITAVMLVSSVASAEAPASPRLGDMGQLVVSPDLSLSASLKGTTQLSSEWSARVALTGGVDRFVLPRLSFGGYGGFVYYASDTPGYYSTHQLEVLAGARIGYAFGIVPGLDFWPQLALGISFTTYQDAHTYPGLEGSSEWKGFSLKTHLLLPLAITIAPRLLLTGGPAIDVGFGQTLADPEPIRHPLHLNYMLAFNVGLSFIL